MYVRGGVLTYSPKFFQNDEMDYATLHSTSNNFTGVARIADVVIYFQLF